MLLTVLNASLLQGAGLSLAKDGCLNVVIVNNFAYAACGQEIEVASLITRERRLISVAADDITADVEAGLLFTQSRNGLSVLSLVDPFMPSVIATANTNFSVFSGLSASSGILVVSAGARGANTQIYNYTLTTLERRVSSIPEIDSATGNPDVHLAQTSTGLIAFYSQDIGGIANFAIQAVSLNGSGGVESIASDVVLTSGRFDFGLNLGPANFPVESEFLNDHLYVAHFAAQGLEVINTNASNGNVLEDIIPLPFVPTNVGTDGELLFVVGSTSNVIAVIDPVSQVLVATLAEGGLLARPTGVSASIDYVAVADRVNGLIVIERKAPQNSPSNAVFTITPAIELLLSEDE